MKPRIVVAGGGPAALEGTLALSSHVGAQAEITVVASGPDFVLRPLAVAEPFGRDEPRRYPLEAIVGGAGASLRSASLAAVDLAGRRATLDSRDAVEFDALLLAVGARPVRAIDGAITFWGLGGDPEFAAGLELLRTEGGEVRFIVPHRVRWTLPLYEVALLAAEDLAGAGPRTRVSVLTPEPEPVAIFGGEVSAAISEALAQAGVEVATSTDPLGSHALEPRPEIGDGHLVNVALPRWEGPRIEGLPADEEGFLQVDELGRVRDAPGVYAAGDATDFPVKQGGLACEQADAAASALAADLGFEVDPVPFERVLRARMYRTDAPIYMRRELDRPDRADMTVADEPLWWPGAKLFGHHLAPCLAELESRGVGGGRPAGI